MTKTITLEKAFDLKAGENKHLSAEVFETVDVEGVPLGKPIYNQEMDKNTSKREKERKLGWTNVGDIGAVIKTTVGLGEVYKNTDTPHVAVSSKHTRPVAIAIGKTQLEALIKATAGDLNSPFGGFYGFNTELEPETAEFLTREGMFYEGALAPKISKEVEKIFENNPERFLIETGELTKADLYVLGATYAPTILGKFIKQSLEPEFDVRKEAVVVTGNNGNTDINSLDDEMLNNIQFAGNAAIYLASNLVFYVSQGAIAGLGDGCGARTVAAEKGRRMLEVSAYAAVSANNSSKWDSVLYDTPFTREEFESIIKPELKIVAFSDAFYPKLDGFVETAGVDRTNSEFGQRKVQIGKQGADLFIPKRDNFDPEYNRQLIPVVIVQPGGSKGDVVTMPLAEKYDIKQVLTMDKDTFDKYQEVGPGKGVSGRRFFGHIIM